MKKKTIIYVTVKAIDYYWTMYDVYLVRSF